MAEQTSSTNDGMEAFLADVARKRQYLADRERLGPFPLDQQVGERDTPSGQHERGVVQLSDPGADDARGRQLFREAHLLPIGDSVPTPQQSQQVRGSNWPLDSLKEQGLLEPRVAGPVPL